MAPAQPESSRLRCGAKCSPQGNAGASVSTDCTTTTPSATIAPRLRPSQARPPGSLTLCQTIAILLVCPSLRRENRPATISLLPALSTPMPPMIPPSIPSVPRRRSWLLAYNIAVGLVSVASITTNLIIARRQPARLSTAFPPFP